MDKLTNMFSPLVILLFGFYLDYLFSFQSKFNHKLLKQHQELFENKERINQVEYNIMIENFKKYMKIDDKIIKILDNLIRNQLITDKNEMKRLERLLVFKKDIYEIYSENDN